MRPDYPSPPPARAAVVHRISMLLAIAVLLLTAAGASAEDGDRVVSKAPDFTLQGIDGTTYKLSSLLEKGPVLLDFWTTWCKPCMQELPQLQKIYERHRERGFTLLGIPSDDQRTAAKIKPTIKAKGFEFPNAPDTDRRVGNLFSVRNYPTTVLISPQGEIVVVAQGYRPGDEKELEARILALLPEAPAEQDEASDEGER